MKKFAILALGLALTGVAGCSEKSKDYTKFVDMCKEDPRAKNQGFNCDCQAKIITTVLKDQEMDQLVNFLEVEKADHQKAVQLGADKAYLPMFQKIAGVGLAIHDKCGNPQAEAQAAAAAPAPAAGGATPAAQPAASAPAAPATK